MKPTMAISVWVLAAGLAVAQNPSVVQNTRATMNGVRDNTAAASNAALAAQSTPAASTAAQASGSAVTVQTSAPSSKAAASKGTQAQVKAHSGHGKKPAHLATAAKGRGKEPKAEALAQNPMGPKKVGEIVASPAPTAADGSSPDDSKANAKYNANGKRDPFISPVVAHVGGPSCASGKKCLEIGAINLRGVVHAESGFIAVVSNSLNKAYFLRENDPVFNGYVVKITGDSIIFQETVQDRLGKTFTREVTKKITVPAV